MSTKLTATDWIWRDGEFVRWEDANVHVLSHSMQYGSSAFEGVSWNQALRFCHLAVLVCSQSSS